MSPKSSMARGSAPHNVIVHVCSIWCSFASEVFPTVDIPLHLAVTDRKKLADCLCECVFARLKVALRRRRKGCQLWNTIDVCLQNLQEWVFPDSAKSRRVCADVDRLVCIFAMARGALWLQHNPSHKHAVAVLRLLPPHLGQSFLFAFSER